LGFRNRDNGRREGQSNTSSPDTHHQRGEKWYTGPLKIPFLTWSQTSGNWQFNHAIFHGHNFYMMKVLSATIGGGILKKSTFLYILMESRAPV
jgi:hypothetical protein